MKNIYTLLTTLLLTLFLASCSSAGPNEPLESPLSSEAPMSAPQSLVESQAPEISGGDASGQNLSETSESQIESFSLAPQTDPTPELPMESQTAPSSAASAVGAESAAEMKIQLTADGEAFSATLLDNSASRDLYSRLPLTLTFEDYNGIEKIAYLSEKLDISDAPSGCDPLVGTLAYYAPWGNLSLFYQDFRQSDGLVPLGELESGVDLFAGQQGDFTVTIEKAN